MTCDWILSTKPKNRRLPTRSRHPGIHYPSSRIDHPIITYLEKTLGTKSISIERAGYWEIKNHSRLFKNCYRNLSAASCRLHITGIPQSRLFPLLYYVYDLSHSWLTRAFLYFSTYIMNALETPTENIIHEITSEPL